MNRLKKTITIAVSIVCAYMVSAFDPADGPLTPGQVNTETTTISLPNGADINQPCNMPYKCGVMGNVLPMHISQLQMGLLWKNDPALWDKPQAMILNSTQTFFASDMVDPFLIEEVIARKTFSKSFKNLNVDRDRLARKGFVQADLLTEWGPAYINSGNDITLNTVVRAFHLFDNGGFQNIEGGPASVRSNIRADRFRELVQLWSIPSIDPATNLIIPLTSQVSAAFLPGGLTNAEAESNLSQFSNAGYSKGLRHTVYGGGHAILEDGRLVIVGGHGPVRNSGIYKVNIFDPNTETWAPRKSSCILRTWNEKRDTHAICSTQDNYGGIRVLMGIDKSGTGVLQDSDIDPTKTMTVCNLLKKTAPIAVAAPAPAVYQIAEIPPGGSATDGTVCTYGGLEILVGLGTASTSGGTNCVPKSGPINGVQDCSTAEDFDIYGFRKYNMGLIKEDGVPNGTGRRVICNTATHKAVFRTEKEGPIGPVENELARKLKSPHVDASLRPINEGKTPFENINALQQDKSINGLGVGKQALALHQLNGYATTLGTDPDTGKAYSIVADTLSDDNTSIEFAGCNSIHEPNPNYPLNFDNDAQDLRRDHPHDQSDMTFARWYTTGVTLPDNRVLIVGGGDTNLSVKQDHLGSNRMDFIMGQGSFGDAVDPQANLRMIMHVDPEIYDPATDTTKVLHTAKQADRKDRVIFGAFYPNANVYPDPSDPTQKRWKVAIMDGTTLSALGARAMDDDRCPTEAQAYNPTLDPTRRFPKLTNYVTSGPGSLPGQAGPLATLFTVPVCPYPYSPATCKNVTAYNVTPLDQPGMRHLIRDPGQNYGNADVDYYRTSGPGGTSEFKGIPLKNAVAYPYCRNMRQAFEVSNYYGDDDPNADPLKRVDPAQHARGPEWGIYPQGMLWSLDVAAAENKDSSKSYWTAIAETKDGNIPLYHSPFFITTPHITVDSNGMTTSYKLCVFGGKRQDTNAASDAVHCIDLMDKSPTWQVVARLADANSAVGSVQVLPDGTVLLGGSGAHPGGVNNRTPFIRIFDYDTNSFRQNSSANTSSNLVVEAWIPSGQHAMVHLLPDGTVFLGGQDGGYTSGIKNDRGEYINGPDNKDRTGLVGQLYYPPYLFNATTAQTPTDTTGIRKAAANSLAKRPVIMDVQKKLVPGQTFHILVASDKDDGTGKDKATDNGIGRVTLIRTGFATHEVSSDMRQIQLSFTKTQKADGTYDLQVKMANSLGTVVPGDYMLFVTDGRTDRDAKYDHGTPSIGKHVRVVRSN